LDTFAWLWRCHTINSSDNILIMCLAQGGILLDITTPSNDGDCLFWYQFIIKLNMGAQK